ncbi:MAG TPA: hypothetical protein VFG30_23120 [Polyangiales bacterium]|nr:hypothetical protein [Polyangiales bacterium]
MPASTGVAGQLAPPPMTGASGAAAGAMAPSFRDSQLDGGMIPIRDSCADGGCKEPDTRVPDDDGFTVAEGDCDDFAPFTNPGAYDVPGNAIDGGTRVLALSSGVARAPGQAGYTRNCSDEFPAVQSRRQVRRVDRLAEHRVQSDAG